MTIDWPAFSPISGIAGGALIGAATAMLLWLNGRIAGVSGIVGGLLRPRTGEIGWRIAFVAGLVAAPLAWAWLAPLPEIRIEASDATLIVAGLLVGAGTRYASGCTSGHGVCGVSRLSPRSLVATGTFIAAGVVAVFLLRHAFAA